MSYGAKSIAEMAMSDDPARRLIAAQELEVTEDNLDTVYWLSKDVERNIKYTALNKLIDFAKSADVKRETFVKLFQFGETMHQYLIQNSHLPEDLMIKILDGMHKWDRASMAQNPQACKKILEKLADDPAYTVREEVAKNVKTTISVIKKLAKDSSKEVKLQVVGRMDITEEIMEILSDDDEIAIRSALARRTDITENLCFKFADDPKPDVRYAIARNPKTYNKVLAKLANDEDLYVRKQVIANPSTPIEVLIPFANQYKSVRARLRDAITNGDSTTKIAIAKETTCLEILRILVRDEDPKVVRRAKKTWMSLLVD